MKHLDSSRRVQVNDIAGSTTDVASMRYLGLCTVVCLISDAINPILTYQNRGTVVGASDAQTRESCTAASFCSYEYHS